MPELLRGKSVGADGTMTPSGWSNSEVFRSYMKNHFLKYVQGRDQSATILALYDGHRSHISLDLIDWAKNNNVILFVLPPHCSHILQPMDVGCFGPFQLKYNQECLSFSRLNHKTVTRYDVCALACKAYTAALSPTNIQAAFSKSGIYPFQSADSMIEKLKQKITPSILYQNETGDNLEIKTEEKNTTEPNELATSKMTPANSDTACREKQTNCTGDSNLSNNEDFFSKKGGEVQCKIENLKKKRRNISHVIGGKAVTEDETLGKMREYLNNTAKKPKKSCNKLTSKSTKTVRKPIKNKQEPKKNKKCIASSDSQQPGPSCINLTDSDDYILNSDEEEHESQMSENEKCCVCKNFYVKSRNVYEIAIVKWAQCESCGHWVHLQYCSPVRVVRKNTPFNCPCCE
ncbi:uncharacterized protein LOC133204990 [Saccostrea echinata]|uniref:uncharacterized protein LOC133204990 n=1 Tax=Saccostrea echinata TaxID=191078 RepID=UPI002A80890D|nr:uncharacterized protein LOC133204990 [Saccostrea echinata]